MIAITKSPVYSKVPDPGEKTLDKIHSAVELGATETDPGWEITVARAYVCESSLSWVYN